MAEEQQRQRYGYNDAEGNRVSALRDMFNGGGPGQSGPTFQGGGIISSLGNAMGGPSAFGFGEGGGDTNRGATIGRTVGGMMFGPLGFIGGGLLGNMLGGGMRRGSAMAPTASEMPTQRPSPAMVAARSPAASIVPMQRPFAPTDAAVPTMPSVPSIMNMPGAVERFITQYGTLEPTIPNTIMMDPAAYTPPPLPGTVMMEPAFSMPSPGVNRPRVSPTGYMFPAAMPNDPQMHPLNTAPLMIDFRSGRPIAMQPPRVQ
jgi:hypothetical protein